MMNLAGRSSRLSELLRRDSEGVEIERFMFALYVGDGQDVIKRIRSQHCGGNVEASALRKHIAERLFGWRVMSTPRPTGSRRVRLDLPEPKIGEQHISAYIKTGHWRLVLCTSYEEAHDFQWYVIEQLKPRLNVTRESWVLTQPSRYSHLLKELVDQPGLNCLQSQTVQSGPGVYVFYHNVLKIDENT